jgi:hypothetical protein
MASGKTAPILAAKRTIWRSRLTVYVHRQAIFSLPTGRCRLVARAELHRYFYMGPHDDLQAFLENGSTEGTQLLTIPEPQRAWFEKLTYYR